MFIFPSFFVWTTDLLQKISGVLGGIVVFAPRINIFLSWESYALVYFLFGGLLGKYKDVFTITWSNKITTLLVGACLVGLWGYGMIFMNVNHAYYDIVVGGYPCILLFISSGVFVISNLKREIKVHAYLKKIIEECSKNSMGIYFIHLLIGTILKRFFMTLKFYDSLVASVIFALVIWMLSLLISMLLYRIPLAKKLITF